MTSELENRLSLYTEIKKKLLPGGALDWFQSPEMMLNALTLKLSLLNKGIAYNDDQLINAPLFASIFPEYADKYFEVEKEFNG